MCRRSENAFGDPRRYHASYDQNDVFHTPVCGGQSSAQSLNALTGPSGRCRGPDARLFVQGQFSLQSSRSGVLRPLPSVLSLHHLCQSWASLARISRVAHQYPLALKRRWALSRCQRQDLPTPAVQEERSAQPRPSTVAREHQSPRLETCCWGTRQVANLGIHGSLGAASTQTWPVASPPKSFRWREMSRFQVFWCAALGSC